jgi:hypothetical protein
MLDKNIRFVGIADYAGELHASFYRAGLVPLMNRFETRQYALQTVFRARTRGGFAPQLGSTRYAVTVYEKLVRATLTIAHPEHEYLNMYLLLSFDVSSDYPKIMDSKVIPFIVESMKTLFENTFKISERYRD